MSASVGHVWRTRNSSSAATWRFGYSITGCVFLLVPVVPKVFRSRLPVDGAGVFVIDRSFRLIRLSRKTVAHLGVAYQAMVSCRHVALQGLFPRLGTVAAVAASLRVGASRQRRGGLVAALFDPGEPAAIAAGFRVGIRSDRAP